MIIKTRPPNAIRSSEITAASDYLNRRAFIRASLAAGAALGAGPAALRASPRQDRLEPNSCKEITTYNNFYEFGLDKEDPSRNAHRMSTAPWTIKVDGLCENPAEYHLEDFVKPSKIEDRIYRFRCVEAWSMVIPWQGFPLADVIRRAAPTSEARYVAFETLWDPEVMPERRWRPVLGWPYREGLRMDEAMHPLTLLATGLFGAAEEGLCGGPSKQGEEYCPAPPQGKPLPNQNGAPLRLVVPWKYGFKSIKSIVRMTFTREEPPTTWSAQSPREYGFYSNVNPDVDHPRWSQARERPIGKIRRVRTLFLNGYADEVGGLYEDMDLTKYF